MCCVLNIAIDLLIIIMLETQSQYINQHTKNEMIEMVHEQIGLIVN